MGLLRKLQNHMRRAYAISVRAREKRIQALTPWAVRATEEVEKGNVLYIVGRTQVKEYSFTWSIEWTEFMNCYISLIGTLSSQPKPWHKLQLRWLIIHVLFFSFFFTCSDIVVFYINILQTTACRHVYNSIIHHLLCMVSMVTSY